MVNFERKRGEKTTERNDVKVERAVAKTSKEAAGAEMRREAEETERAEGEEEEESKGDPHEAMELATDAIANDDAGIRHTIWERKMDASEMTIDQG